MSEKDTSEVEELNNIFKMKDKTNEAENKELCQDFEKYLESIIQYYEKRVRFAHTSSNNQLQKNRHLSLGGLQACGRILNTWRIYKKRMN